MNIIDHGVSLQGSVMQICIALGGFSKKVYSYFQTRCYLFTHHASERSLYSFGNRNNNNNQTHSNSYYYWLSNYSVLHVTVCFIISYIMIIIILSHMSFNIYSKSERYCYLNFKNEKLKVQRAKSLAQNHTAFKRLRESYTSA